MSDQALVRWRRKPRPALPEPARGFDVTDPDLDAPGGAIVDGFERVGERWKPIDSDGSTAGIVPTVDHAAALAKLAPTIADAAENLRHKRAPRTLVTYAAEWSAFLAWCAEHGGIQSCPVHPEALALYVAALGKRRKASGISVALAAIAWNHREAREASPHRHPAVLDQIEGIRRQRGTRPERKAPLTADILSRVVEPIADDLEGKRDRAILLVCFAGAFRRSELVGLDAHVLTFGDQGVEILLGRSKTDQAGAGMVKAIPFAAHEKTCPVRALRAWLDAAGITEGPIFRSLDPAAKWRVERGRGDRLSGGAVATIVKARCAAVGLAAREFSGHSPRAGLVTSAARAGRDVWEIMSTTGHKDMATVAAYVREAQSFQRSAARGLL